MLGSFCGVNMVIWENVLLYPHFRLTNTLQLHPLVELLGS